MEYISSNLLFLPWKCGFYRSGSIYSMEMFYRTASIEKNTSMEYISSNLPWKLDSMEYSQVGRNWLVLLVLFHGTNQANRTLPWKPANRETPKTVELNAFFLPWKEESVQLHRLRGFSVGWLPWKCSVRLVGSMKQNQENQPISSNLAIFHGIKLPWKVGRNIFHGSVFFYRSGSIEHFHGIYRTASIKATLPRKK